MSKNQHANAHIDPKLEEYLELMHIRLLTLETMIDAFIVEHILQSFDPEATLRRFKETTVTLLQAHYADSMTPVQQKTYHTWRTRTEERMLAIDRVLSEAEQ